MIKRIKIVFDMLVSLFSKIIREQYSISYWEHYHIITRIKSYLNFKFHKKYLLVNSIDNLKVGKELLFSKENRISSVESPLLVTKEGNKYKINLEGGICDISVYMLKNAFVCAGTDLIGDKNAFYHYELLNMEAQHDLKAADIFKKSTNDKYKKIENLNDILNLQDQYLIFNNKTLRFNDNTIYISLLKEHSVNYYHWITEIMPRLIVIRDALNSNNISLNECTILIDNNMPKQIFETISVVLGTDIRIKIIERANLVYCKKIIYCTPLWLSLDNTKGLPNPRKEFFLDKHALDIVKEAIISKVDFYKEKPKRMIYLQRLNNKLRPISNLDLLEDMIEKLGFEFIDVGILTFKEQLKLFSEAKLVIGVSGAAFTNILFMQPESYAISLYPSTKSTNYYVFQPLADSAGVNLIHFLTKPKKGEVNVHAEASVNIKRLRKVILEVIEND